MPQSPSQVDTSTTDTTCLRICSPRDWTKIVDLYCTAFPQSGRRNSYVSLCSTLDEQYRGYFWVRVDNEQSISADFLRISVNLGLIDPGENDPEVVNRDIGGNLDSFRTWTFSWPIHLIVISSPGAAHVSVTGWIILPLIRLSIYPVKTFWHKFSSDPICSFSYKRGSIWIGLPSYIQDAGSLIIKDISRQLSY